MRFAFSGDTRHSYKPFTIMDAIREKKPEFFLHLGDTIYGDLEGAARSLSQFREKYVNNRKDEPTQRLLSETSLFVVWDDHEVADNYRAANPLAPVGRRAFMDYWPVRQDPADGQRTYRSSRWGRARILHSRYPAIPRRVGRHDSQRATKTMVPRQPRQLQCFLQIRLHVGSFFQPRGRQMGRLPADRDEVLKVIKQKRIDGIIFLSADVHYAAAVRVPGNAALREIIVGPLAAHWGEQRERRSVSSILTTNI